MSLAEIVSKTNNESVTIWIRDGAGKSVGQKYLQDAMDHADLNYPIKADSSDYFLSFVSKTDALRFLEKNEAILIVNKSPLSNLSPQQQADIVDAPNEPCAVCKTCDPFNNRYKKFGNQVRCFRHMDC